MNATPAPQNGLAAITPSQEAAQKAKDAAEDKPAKSIEAILQVTIYNTHSDTELKFKARDIPFDELAREFLVISKHFAQLHERGNNTHDFDPDNKSKEDIVITADDLKTIEPGE